jgi:protein-L-isoaspartate(D-aspartate) O-methyltransferase
MDTDTTTVLPEALRAEMVAKVRTVGYAQLRAVERIMLGTPRHEFVPDAGLDAAYDP